MHQLFREQSLVGVGLEWCLRSKINKNIRKKSLPPRLQLVAQPLEPQEQAPAVLTVHYTEKCPLCRQCGA